MTKKQANDIVCTTEDIMNGVDKMPPLSEARKRAKAKYNAKMITKISLELYPNDEDILKKLQEQPSKQGYIKELIRKDIQ